MAITCCNSYLNAAALLNFQLVVACPVGYEPKCRPRLKKHKEPRVTVVHNTHEASKRADLIVTWTRNYASMGQEDEQEQRLKDLNGFPSNSELMAKANPVRTFIICLGQQQPGWKKCPCPNVHRSATDSVRMGWSRKPPCLHAQKRLLWVFLLGARTQ